MNLQDLLSALVNNHAVIFEAGPRQMIDITPQKPPIVLKPVNDDLQDIIRVHGDKGWKFHSDTLDPSKIRIAKGDHVVTVDHATIN